MSAGTTGRKLHDNDRRNLAKAVSGFGNSEGGVIVWGVDCSGTDDVASSKTPLCNIQRFKGWIENAISGCTVPPHATVENHCILSGATEGYLVTYIPKSVHAPHQIVRGYTYYIRAGSSFVPTPHSVLAGMFGRRPQPRVNHVFTIGPVELDSASAAITVRAGVMMHNHGPGIARDLFLNLKVFSVPGENCSILLDPLDLEEWRANRVLGRFLNMIAHSDVRLAPEAQLQPVSIHLGFQPPFTDDLRIEGICGCAEAPASRFIIENTQELIEAAYTDNFHLARSSSRKEKVDIAKKLFRAEQK